MAGSATASEAGNIGGFELIKDERLRSVLREIMAIIERREWNALGLHSNIDYYIELRMEDKPVTWEQFMSVGMGLASMDPSEGGFLFSIHIDAVSATGYRSISQILNSIQKVQFIRTDEYSTFVRYIFSNGRSVECQMMLTDDNGTIKLNCAAG